MSAWQVMPNAAAADRLEVTRTYLELRERPAPQASPWPPGITLHREAHCSVALARGLYAAVGRPYHWYDRDAWPDQRLAGHLALPNVEVWVLRDAHRPVGYFELAREESASVEVVYFGLIPGAQGRGLGKRLLEAAIAAGFSSNATRVWLHTCTLDHPAALPNYQARGFAPFRTERYEVARSVAT
ncbi:MAG: GNAT family N-acetyltransferase [Gemmatimonadaceae bacterium]